MPNGERSFHSAVATGSLLIYLATLMVSATTDHGLALANELRPVLLRLARELRKETEQFGVTARQVTLLVLVDRSPGLTLRALADAEAISAPALSGQIDRLEQAGLLVRVRSEVDRRRVGLELTAEGARLLRSVRERRTAWLAERLSALEPEALEAIDEAIGPLRQLLGERL